MTKNNNMLKQLPGFLKLAVVFFLLTSCVDDARLEDNLALWVGSWTCNEIEGDFAPQTYQIEIVEKVDYNEVAIKGLYNQGQLFSVDAEISGGSIFIPSQTVQQINIEGTGSLDNSEITLFFTANDGSGPDQVEAILYR
ncbi:MAG: hypothetical protein N4A46_08765 [Schleiferiaceae bacterium]|nr:hypothetical protein [Schleiferiaceae bacterium]